MKQNCYECFSIKDVLQEVESWNGTGGVRAQTLTSILQAWHSWINLRCRESGDVDLPEGNHREGGGDISGRLLMHLQMWACWSAVSAVGKSGSSCVVSAWRSLRWDEERQSRCGRVQLGVTATETNWTCPNALSLLMSPRWSSGTNNCYFISSLHITHTFLFRQSLPLIPARNSGKSNFSLQILNI